MGHPLRLGSLEVHTLSRAANRFAGGSYFIARAANRFAGVHTSWHPRRFVAGAMKVGLGGGGALVDEGEGGFEDIVDEGLG